MNHEVRQALTRYHMLEQGDHICVALSGGADSVSLLSFFKENQAELGITLSACHLNHQLRGEESDRDEQFVRELCARWTIPVTVERTPVADLAQNEHLSLEECGRRERYRLFAQLQREQGCKVATAHTRSDSMETMLLNLTRGTGVRGLSGIPAVRDKIIRPLILCTRQQVEAYCAARGLAYVTDSSNLTDDYTRNAIRHRVIPELYRFNPALDQAMGRMMETAAEMDVFMEKLAVQAEQSLRQEGGWSRQGFLALERPVAWQLLARLARQRGEFLSAGQGQRCMELAKTGGTLDLSAHTVYQVKEETIGFIDRPIDQPTPMFSIPVVLGQEKTCVYCPQVGKMLDFSLCICEQMVNFASDRRSDLKNQIDYDKISGTVILRTRRPGDRFHLVGRGCGKTLKKWMNEQAVPLNERDRLLVLADDLGILWVEGFGPDTRCSLESDTKRRLLLVCSQVEDMTNE